MISTFLLVDSGALHSNECAMKRSDQPWKLRVTSSGSDIVLVPKPNQDVLEYNCMYSGKSYVGVGSNETLFRLALDHLWGLDDVNPDRVYKRPMTESNLDWEELKKRFPSGQVIVQPEDYNHDDMLAVFPEKCLLYADKVAKGMDVHYAPAQELRNYISDRFGVERVNEIMMLSDVSSEPVKEDHIILKLKELAGRSTTLQCLCQYNSPL